MNLKVISLVSVLVVAGLFAFSKSSDLVTLNPEPTQPCEQPLTYRFGDIDSRFNISQEQLSDVMKKVENLWSAALDKDLLDYHEEGKVTIHLVYSEEQERTKAQNTFAKRIEVKQKVIETKEQEYNQSLERYQNKKDDFQSIVNEYNKSVETYNNHAEKWKDKKVTAQAKNKFKRLKRDISRLESRMKDEQQELETQRQRTNSKSRQLNRLVEEQNKMAADYNSRFSDTQKFDQGHYIKKGNTERINIYQFANHAQLKTVLAHEAGHAFGLGHVDNPKSIMNEMMKEQNIFNLQLSDEDISAVKNLCSD